MIGDALGRDTVAPFRNRFRMIPPTPRMNVG